MFISRQPSPKLQACRWETFWRQKHKSARSNNTDCRVVVRLVPARLIVKWADDKSNNRKKAEWNQVIILKYKCAKNISSPNTRQKNDKTSFKFFFEQGYCVTCGLFDFGIYFFCFLLPRSGGVPLRWRPFLFLPSKKRKVSSLLSLSSV